MQPVELIKDILRCPSCRKTLEINQNQITCLDCNAIYPIREGVVDFISNGKIVSGAIEKKTIEYEEKYQSLDNAIRYNEKYIQKKKMRTDRENKILGKLLDSRRTVRSILDLPSGGGRLSSLFAENCELLVEMDISLGQIRYGIEHCKIRIPQVWLRASSFEVPLADKSVDGVVCIRLCHHFYSLDEVEKLIAEILRVAQSFVIVSFSNANSLKNIYRRLRGIRIQNRFTKGDIARIAARHDARLVSCQAMAALRSHCYALMEKIW